MPTPPSFPFDAVAITFPDAQAARSASSGPLQALRRAYPRTLIVATQDPLGCRVGSGGGTLHALEQVNTALLSSSSSLKRQEPPPDAQEPPSILILHAGGASSRCPSQMVLGKAWTSLPMVQTQQEQQQQESLQTPLRLWFQLCQETLFQDLPKGSLVVIASDTLLDIPSGANDNNNSGATIWKNITQQHEDNAVVALSVPAALNVAKNHGVFVPKEQQPQKKRPNDETESNGDSNGHGNNNRQRQQPTMLPGILPCAKVYQKPSLETLQRDCAFVIPKDDTADDDDDPQQQQAAWIDTGVIVFLPQAAQALHTLVSQSSSCDLLCCTLGGIQAKYDKQGQEQQSLLQFASNNANSIDLYTHLLNALQLSENDNDKEPAASDEYCQLYQQELPRSVLELLYETLRPSPLLVWTVPTGTFLHLGTTRELMQFLTTTATTTATTETSNQNASQQQDPAQALRQHMATSLGLTPWFHARAMTKSSTSSKSLSPSSWPGVVAVESHLAASAITIGTGSVLEHCFLHMLSDEDNNGSGTRIDIGKDCLVSGVRCCASNGPRVFGLSSGLMVQQVTLKTGDMVFMVMAIQDNIKTAPCPALYGISIAELLQATGLTKEELWQTDKNKSSLWNAKIHPTLPVSSSLSFNNLFDWVNQLVDQGPNAVLDSNSQASLQLWRERPRLSLADIREAAHAPSEFDYRARLSMLVAPPTKEDDNEQFLLAAQTFWNKHNNLCQLRPILMGRQHTSVPTLIGEGDDTLISSALQTLDEVIVDAFELGKYDVCGRSWMLMSAMLAEYVTTESDTDAAAFPQSIEKVAPPPSFSDSTDMASIVDHFATVRDKYFLQGDDSNGVPISALVEVSEQWAQCMTRHCVMGAQYEKALACRPKTPNPQDIVLDRWVMANAAARVDLAGGWSDTPPICFEYGSSVTGVAVCVDGIKPLACRTRLSQNGTSVVLKSEHRDFEGHLLSTEQVEIKTVGELKGFNVPSETCALLKCALVVLGVVSADQIAQLGGESLASILAAFCDSSCESLGLQVIVTSLLPHGSGMGSSSIIAGCVLSSMAKCLGIDFGSLGTTKQNGVSLELVQSVIALEQVLTTGGGHQDQVNGLFPGTKIVHCRPLEFPLRLSIDPIPMEEKFEQELNENLVLVFTGQTRLAKNILQSCLRRWATRSPSIVENVKGLIENAIEAEKALLSSSMDKLGQAIDTYWEQKKFMAGAESGVEPELVKSLIWELREAKAIHGASLCGAGGGGFMVLLKSHQVSMAQIESMIHDVIGREEAGSCKVYGCSISNQGLHVMLLPEHVAGEDEFDLEWLKTS